MILIGSPVKPVKRFCVILINSVPIRINAAPIVKHLSTFKLILSGSITENIVELEDIKNGAVRRLFV
jgi:hypothetical protein